MKKFLLSAIVLTVAAFVFIGLTGCSSSKTSATSTGNVVNISNFSFSQGSLNVSMGTTVTWTNNDSATHRVVSDTGLFDSGDLSQGGTFSYTFNTAGSYPYHCSIHTYMKGTIIVK